MLCHTATLLSAETGDNCSKKCCGAGVAAAGRPRGSAAVRGARQVCRLCDPRLLHPGVLLRQPCKLPNTRLSELVLRLRTSAVEYLGCHCKLRCMQCRCHDCCLLLSVSALHESSAHDTYSSSPPMLEAYMPSASFVPGTCFKYTEPRYCNQAATQE